MKQFKDFITEARQLPEFEAMRAQFNGVIVDGLAMVIRGQVAHWTTKNYATHEALGEFYETLKEQLDHLVESGIAVGFSADDLRDINLYIQGNDLETFENSLMEYRASVVDAISACLPSMSAIEDILVSIQKTTDMMSYKLTLS